MEAQVLLAAYRTQTQISSPSTVAAHAHTWQMPGENGEFIVLTLKSNTEQWKLSTKQRGFFYSREEEGKLKP